MMGMIYSLAFPGEAQLTAVVINVITNSSYFVL